MIEHPLEEFLGEFVLEARERLDEVEGLLIGLGAAAPAERRRRVERAKRELHTLKGNSGMLGLKDLQAHAHRIEQRVVERDAAELDVVAILAELDRFRSELAAIGGRRTETEPREEPVGAEAEPEVSVDLAHGSVRVPFDRLDALVDLLAEMVIFRNRLADTVDRGRRLGPGDDPVSRWSDAWADVANARETLDKTLDALRTDVMRLRMVPLRSLFRQLHRIIHDEGIKGGKEVRLETEGGETPLDKALLELASEALGHLVRNAVIHGIERPEERAAAEKARAGTVRVVASVTANEVGIVVSDDGAGVDPEAVRRVASARGIDVSEYPDALRLLFLPGLSTRGEVDVAAGRGIGLSAVHEAVRRRGGRIEAASEKGHGTTFRLHLPLSVSITRALLLRVDSEEYALPLASVVESRRLRPGDQHQVNHAGVLRWRDRVLPLLDLGRSFETASQVRREGYVIVIEADGKYRGLVADEVVGVREIVVKGLDPMCGTPRGIAGSTILGDGRAILILDPRGLAELEPFVEEPHAGPA